MATRFCLAFFIISLAAPSAIAETYADVRTQVFQKYCLDCHSPPGPAAGLDLGVYQSLIAAGVVVPGKPADSLLFQKLEMGEMPQGGDPLTPDELKLIADWILAGAPDAPPAKEMSVSQLSPRFGPTTGNTLVEIKGDFLSKTKEVTFGSELCTQLTIVSDQALKCLAPSQKVAGLVSIVVTDGSNEAKLENAYDYRLPLGPTYEALRANVFKPVCMRCHSGDKPAKGLDLSTYRTALSHRRAVIPFNLKESRVYKKTASGEMPRGGPALEKDAVSTIAAWIRAGAPEK
jgi:mono/diheme cytochrome c family protein